jgi:uncharacterized protein YuzE
VGETGEPATVEVDSEGVVAGAEGVDAHVELATPEKERV